MDPDYVTYEMLEMGVEMYGFINTPNIWLRIPGKDSEAGLTLLNDDNSARNLINEMCKGHLLEVYAEDKDGELVELDVGNLMGTQDSTVNNNNISCAINDKDKRGIKEGKGYLQ